MFCPVCGNNNPDGAAACARCGNALPSFGVQPAQGQPAYAPPQQPAYTPPPQNRPAYAPPPQQNQYAPPPQNQYAPPPQSQPAYVPPRQNQYAPQQQTAYTPPQNQPYTPPQQNQYAPPPQNQYAPPQNQPAYKPPAQQQTTYTPSVQQQPPSQPQAYVPKPAFAPPPSQPGAPAGQQQQYGGFVQTEYAPAPVKKKKNGLIIALSAAGVVVIAFAIILFTVILPGQTDEGQIKSIIKAFESASNSGSIDPIRQYLPPGMSQREIAELESGMDMLGAAGAMGAQYSVSISYSEIEFSMDKTAARVDAVMTIHVSLMGQSYDETQKSTLYLQKIDGKWYISEDTF